MPEQVIDDGMAADTGHESGRRQQSARQRPDDVPAAWVYDRQQRRWREPRRPGPRRRDGGEDPDGPGGDAAGPGPGGWQADRDPDPAHLAGESGPRQPRPEPSQEVKDNVTGLLALLAVPVGALAERQDPYCGAVFAGQLPQIVHAAVPLVCRSPRVVRWMTADTGGLMDWIGLAQAMAPVAAAIVQHHVVKTVRLEGEEEQPGAQMPDFVTGVA